MGHVYEAENIKLERRLAFKVLPAWRIKEDPSLLQRFERERTVQGKLEHPNIVTVFDAGEEEGDLWIAMQLISEDGRSLRTLLGDDEPEALPPQLAIDLLAPIAAALDYAHDPKQGKRTHRDVKPENILLDDDDRPYLTDFGITKALGDPRLTTTGGGIGSPAYMSPEQSQGKDIDVGVDVYSLAVVLFECLTGTLPFVAHDRVDLAIAHRHQERPDASERKKSLPRSIDPILRRGMSADPEARPKGAGVLIEDARKALLEGNDESPARSRAVVPVPIVKDPPPPSPPKTVRQRPPRAKAEGASEEAREKVAAKRRDNASRRRALLALAAIVLAVGALALGASMSESPQAPEPVAVDTGELRLRAPAGWKLDRDEPAIGGLALEEPANLEPPPESDERGVTISAGMSPARGATLLPPAYRSQLGKGTHRTSVSLGPLQAYRYEGLSAPGSGEAVVAFVAPTSRGVATLACRMADGERRLAAGRCGRVASTLRLEKGVVYPLGPSAAMAGALRGRIDRLAQRRAKARSMLASVGESAKQGAAADDLADAFRDAARGLASLSVSPQSAAGRDAVVAALRSARDAYKRLGTAARKELAGRYRAAASSVKAAERAVNERLRELRGLGYEVDGDAVVAERAPGS
jgi:serine/threonine-protein kinase